MDTTASTLPTEPAVVREHPGGETMRAIILNGFGGLDSLVYADIPKPLPKDGEVVIAVKGFGINHAELHMRRGEWAEAAEVSGIECVGIVDSCPGGEFPVGAKVAALMGGLGRTINGSYAEYTRVRAANVALIESDLPWSVLAALPLQDIARQVAEGKLDATPSRVFSFDQIHEAHRVMEAGEAGGKMVVVMD